MPQTVPTTHEAIALLSAGKLEAADKICQQLLEMTPTDSNLLHLAGVIRLSLDQHSHAMTLFDAAIAQ